MGLADWIKAKIFMSAEGVTSSHPTTYSSPQAETERRGMVQALSNRYKGSAENGNELVKTIVHVKTAFVWAGGISAVPEEEEYLNSPEMDFINLLIKDNKLDGYWGQGLGDERSLEGQVLVRLKPQDIEENGVKRIMIKLGHVNWLDFDYVAQYKDDDANNEFEGVTYQSDKNEEQTIPASDCVFFKFNARLSDKEGTPEMGTIIQELDWITENLAHWAAINYLFSHPTPYFKTKTIPEARKTLELLASETVNWKLGEIFAGTAEFSLETGAGDYESIEKFIQTCLRFVSGNTNVPTQFMGYPDLMSNRATAENTMEPVGVTSEAEQAQWIDGFTELFNKAIEMKNKQGTKNNDATPKLKTGKIKASMSFVTQLHLKLLKDFYVPLYEGGSMTLETLLSKLPGIIAHKEAEKVKKLSEEKEAARQQYLKDLAAQGTQNPEIDDQDIDE